MLAALFAASIIAAECKLAVSVFVAEENDVVDAVSYSADSIKSLRAWWCACRCINAFHVLDSGVCLLPVNWQQVH